MTKEKVDKLFEDMDKGNCIGLLSFIKNESLKGKILNASDIEEEFEKNYDEFIKDICEQVQEELREYFCDEAIEKREFSFISTLYKDDDKKIEIIDRIEREYDRTKVAITIEDDDKKIKLLDKFDEIDSKVSIVKTIKDDNKKIKLLNKFDYIDSKVSIVKSIKNDDKKIKLLDEFDDIYNKVLIVKSIENDEKKIKLLDMFDNINLKIEIVMTIVDKDKKLEMLNKLGYKCDELQVVKDIRESNNNIDAMSKYINNEIEDQILGLPSDMTIGIELEVEGEMSDFIVNRNIMSTWKAEVDSSIPGGVEVISPILQDNPEDIQTLDIICTAMQKAGFETTEKCGGHIHIGADYLKGNPQALENLIIIWNECEELFYKMGNEKGNIPRSKITYYAKTSQYDLEDMFPGGAIRIKDEAEFERIRSILIQKEPKCRGLNLGHYGEKDKNTIEFRISNSTLNPQVVKDNIRLFGSLMKVSKEMSLNPGYKNEEFKIMKNRSLTEREKVEALLELLFEDEKIKGIYRERWESVRNKEIFDELTLGQKQTFERGNYQIKKENCRRVAEQIKVIEEMNSVANEIRKELEQSKELNYYN